VTHEWQNLSPGRRDCNYHVVILPNYRRKVFDGRRRRQIGVILREVCRPRGIESLEGQAMPDHVPRCLSIPPEYSVAHAVGFLKGQRAVRIHRELLHERRLTGLPFGAAGYCVSTVGLGEARVRRSIREREELERRRGEFDFEEPLRPRGGLPDVPAPGGGYRTEPAPSGGPS
jgi:putative transposase